MRKDQESADRIAAAPHLIGGEFEVLPREEPCTTLHVDPDVAGIRLGSEGARVAAQNRMPHVRRNTRMLRGELGAETGGRVFGVGGRHSASGNFAEPSGGRG